MRRASHVTMMIVTAGAATLLVGPAAFSKRPKPPACPGATYTVDPPLLAEGSSPAGALVLATSTAVSIDGVCDPIAPRRFKATRRNTKVKAVWDACDALTGRVKLTGKIVDDCGTLRGKVRAKKFRRRLDAPRAEIREAATTIGPAGGQVVSGDGRLTLDLPPGALSADTIITVRTLDPTTVGADAAYALGPDGQTFAQPILATFTLPPTAIGPDDVLAPDMALVVASDENGESPEVIGEQTLVVDAVAGTASLSAPLTHFSRIFNFRPRDRVEAQRARVQVGISPGTQLQIGQAFTVDLLLIAGIAQREAKDVVHDDTVPPGDRVVYSGAPRVVVGTIDVGESRGGGTVTGYACGPLAGFGAYSGTVSAVVEPSIDFGLLEIGGSVSLTTHLRVQIGCSAPTTTSTSSSSTTSTSTTTVTVSSTTSTSTSTTTTTSTSSTSTTSTSATTSTSTTTSTLPTLGGCCECGPGMCASGPAITAEDCPIACAPMSGTFTDNSECNLTTGHCDPPTGRAVILTHTIGPFLAGEPLCLHLVRQSPDGCIGIGSECLDEAMNPAAHLHRAIEVVGVGTGIADPIPGGCGHGRVAENVPGCLPENPIVPNCQ